MFPISNENIPIIARLVTESIKKQALSEITAKDKIRIIRAASDRNSVMNKKTIDTYAAGKVWAFIDIHKQIYPDIPLIFQFDKRNILNIGYVTKNTITYRWLSSWNPGASKYFRKAPDIPKDGFFKSVLNKINF